MSEAPSPAAVPACLNCGTPLAGAYCHVCGQRADTERITTKRLWGQIFEAFTDLDRGFLHTLKVLTVAPGRAIKDYLAGQRAPMYNPFRFYILTAASLIIVTQLTGFDLIAQSAAANNEAMGVEPSASQQQFQKDFGRLMSENMQSIQLVFLPFIAFGSWIAFGRRAKKNYAELLVYQCYASGYSSLLTALLIPVFHYVPGAKSLYFPISMVLYVLLNVFFAYGLFGRNWFGLAVRSVLAFVIYMTAAMLIFIPLMIIYVIMHPELFR